MVLHRGGGAGGGLEGAEMKGWPGDSIAANYGQPVSDRTQP